MTGKGAVLAANSRVQARPAAAKSLAGQQKLRERPQQQLQHKSLLKEAASKQQAGAKLSDRKLLQYERQGFLVTKQLLPVQQVQQVRECVQQVVQERRLEALKHRQVAGCQIIPLCSAVVSISGGDSSIGRQQSSTGNCLCVTAYVAFSILPITADDPDMAANDVFAALAAAAPLHRPANLQESCWQTNRWLADNPESGLWQ